ncbi:MAG: two-component regulator propeller domain-containing protein [Ferruginibacter sp.]
MISKVDAQQVSVFQSYTTKDGLPSDYVFDICEDSNGFLWLGTDKGLVKYDGFNWQLITTENGLPGNYINKVLNAGKNGLWLMVSAKGIYHYNTTTGAIRFVTANFLHHYLQTNSLGELFFYNDRFNHPKGINWGTKVEPVHLKTTTIFEDHHLKFYGKAIFIDFANKQLLALPLKNVLAENKVDFELPKEWSIASFNETVEEKKLYEKVDAHIYKNNSSIYFFLPGKARKKIILFDYKNEYLNALRTSDGVMVWNEKDGLYEVKENGTITHFTEKDGLANLMVTDVHLLKNGHYMISTLGGGLFYMLHKGNARIDTDNKPIKGLAQYKQTIYALLDDKLLTFDITHPETVSVYPINDKNVQSIQVFDNEIIITSLAGFSIYTIRNNILITKHTIKNGAGISGVLKSGSKYIAGTYGVHIITYANLLGKGYVDKSTPAINEGLQSISNGYVTYNYEDGLRFVYNNQTQQALTIKDGLPSNAVFDVHEYKDSFWISTAKGLAVFMANKLVKSYDHTNGIKGSRCVFSFHDNKGKLWLVSDKYLHEFDGTTFTALSSASIIEGNTDNVHAYVYHAATNTLVTGSLKRIFLTQLNSLVKQDAVITTSLEKINSPNNIINNRTNFTLPIQYKYIDFTFKPFLVNPFTKATVYYKLTGQDENFSVLRDSLTIRYSNLRSGDYTLISKTVNSDGLESETIVLAKFTIDIPYWEKGWFIALSIFSGAILFSGIVFYLSKRKEKKLQQKQLIETQLNKERERISKDLHDHLGTSLVTMIAQTDNIESKLMNHQTAEALEKVKQLSIQSRDTVNVLRETIWAVQENSHTIHEFEMRVRSFLQRVLASYHIEWQVEVIGSSEKNLSANQSLQLFRIIQEATQNIIKHANATNAHYCFEVKDNHLTIQIKDNGKGFVVENNFNGNGLNNMQQRIIDINGKIAFKNDNGCTVEFSTQLY